MLANLKTGDSRIKLRNHNEPLGMGIHSTALIAALLISSTAPAAGHGSEEGFLTAEEIVSRSLERTESQYRNYTDANFRSESVTKNQKLNSDGEITATEVLRHSQYPLDGAVFEELIEKNGRPLNEREQKEEAERKREFLQEVAKRRDRGDYLQPDKERAVRFDRDFVNRYRYKLLEEQTVRSHPCWVIAFKPGEGPLPVRSTMDHALNQLEGKLWISRDDYGLARVEFAMRKPFKYWGGLLAVIRKTDGYVEYERVEPDAWLPLHFNLKLDIRIMLLKNIRQLISKDWSGYERVPLNNALSFAPE